MKDENTGLVTCDECGASINDKSGLRYSNGGGDYCEPHAKAIIKQVQTKHFM